MDNITALDTETFLIGPGNLAPKIVCLSWAQEGLTNLIGNNDMQYLKNCIEGLLQHPGPLVGHTVSYDLTVIAANFPDLFPLIWTALEDGRIHDTRIREKLLNLSTTGKMDELILPDGSKQKINYHLSGLVAQYLGEDRTDVKTGDDIWRLNYHTLDGYKAEDYPDEAREYAIQDVTDTLKVYKAQADRAETMKASLETETFHVGVDFALRLMTCWGIAIDPEAKAIAQQKLEEELAPDRLNLLIENGILIPERPPRPFKNGAKNADGTPKMTKGKKASIKKEPLTALVERVCLANNMPIKKTDKGNIVTDADVIESIAHLDPILGQYQHRQLLQKLVTTELPAMEWGEETAEIIYPNYDVLKETGRTSSFGNKKGKGLYPSTNIQQKDPRIRGCYIPRPGWVMYSCDYSGLELCSLAQKCYTLFGKSVMRDLINADIDIHAYMGAVMARHLDEQFREACDAEALSTNMEYYEAFSRLQEGNEEVQNFYHHYRTFAKPFDLGLPGGLGAETFISFARGYGVHVNEDQAVELKKVWLKTFPEMVRYFEWINAQEDERNIECYAYQSPLGMVRRGASYCAAANGAGMQTPAGEGAKLAVFNVQRACTDPSMENILYGTKPLAFIHDELLGEIPEDDLMHERAQEISRIMVESMELILPDVKIKAETALMRRWNKKAKPIYDSTGRLQVWEEPQETPVHAA